MKLHDRYKQLMIVTDDQKKLILLFKKTFFIAMIFIAVGFTLDVVTYDFTAGEAGQRVLDNLWKPFAFAFAVAVFFNPRPAKKS